MNGKDNSTSSAPNDPFTGFWVDMMSRMAGGVPTSGARDEMFRQMRQAFFDAWGKHAEEFMRSEAFLESMKRSMDAALAFKQQINEFLTRALHESQAPARSDIDSILLVLRSLEERMQQQFSSLNQRIDALAKEKGPSATEAAAARGKGIST